MASAKLTDLVVKEPPRRPPMLVRAVAFAGRQEPRHGVLSLCPLPKPAGRRWRRGYSGAKAAPLYARNGPAQPRSPQSYRRLVNLKPPPAVLCL